jgi:hypothetical protein
MLVTEDDRRLLTAVTVDLVDHPGSFFLVIVLVARCRADIAVHARQQFATDDHAARRGLDRLRRRIAFLVDTP